MKTSGHLKLLFCSQPSMAPSVLRTEVKLLGQIYPHSLRSLWTLNRAWGLPNAPSESPPHVFTRPALQPVTLFHISSDRMSATSTGAQAAGRQQRPHTGLLRVRGLRAVRNGEHELTSARILGATAAIGLCGRSGVCVARKPRSRPVAGHPAVNPLQDSDTPLCSGDDSFGTF